MSNMYLCSPFARKKSRVFAPSAKSGRAPSGHRHDAGVQLRSEDTDYSPHLEKALLQRDPVNNKYVKYAEYTTFI